MSQDNELMKRAFAAFADGDYGTVLGLIDPTFQVNDPIIGSPAERGLDALIANTAAVREAIGDASRGTSRDHRRRQPNLGPCAPQWCGRHTSLPVGGDVGHIYTLKGRRAVRLDIYRTWQEALEAAGLSE